MSQRDRVVFRTLRELGAAFAARSTEIETSTASSGMEAPEVRRAFSERALLPLGDRPRCPCGKVSYPDRATAERAIRELGAQMRVYRCSWGHPVWHLMGVGRSRRERTGR
jgi:hypothetical protein